MRKFILPAIASACLTLASCGTDITRECSYGSLKLYDPQLSDAAIYVIGDAEACALAAAELVAADDRDNIDGSFNPDLLPDFAGERIASFADVANGPHDSLLIAGKGDMMRELVVRSVLEAVDTICCLSPFDVDGQGHKSAAKLVVLADPAAAFYGYYDIDSLLTASSCRLPVVSPLYALSRELVNSDNLNVGVITSSERVSSGIYTDVFQKAATTGGFKGIRCSVYSCESDEDPLLSFLDSYISGGEDIPLDFLLVDVPGSDMSQLNMTLERIRSVMNEESLFYASYMDADFRLVNTASTLRSECYRILRERNLFTHRISMPMEEHYLNVSRTSSRDSLQTNVLIEYNPRYIPE